MGSIPQLLTEGIIIVAVSAVVSFGVAHLKIKHDIETQRKDLKIKYHEKIFDEQYELYKEFVTYMANQNNNLARSGPEGRKEIIDEYYNGLLDYFNQAGLIFNANVFYSIGNLIQHVIEIKNKDEITKDDIISISKVGGIITNQIRKTLGLKELSKSYLKDIIKIS